MSEKVTEILEKVADWYEENPLHWTQWAFARDVHGNELKTADEAASCCAIGAIEKFTVVEAAAMEAKGVLRRHLGLRSIATWNDDPYRTVTEVIEAFRGAAARARVEETHGRDT